MHFNTHSSEKVLILIVRSLLIRRIGIFSSMTLATMVEMTMLALHFSIVSTLRSKGIEASATSTLGRPNFRPSLIWITVRLSARFLIPSPKTMLLSDCTNLTSYLSLCDNASKYISIHCSPQTLLVQPLSTTALPEKLAISSKQALTSTK